MGSEMCIRDRYTLGFTISGTPNGSEVLTVVPVDDGIYDAVGNESSTTQSNNTINLNDKTSPTISSVTATTANGSYKAGGVIAVQVVFTEAVTVTGTPQLTLETGGSDAVVNYASGTGGTTLTFNYTVASGHNSSDLDYATTDALGLNGGTIKDAAGNNANLDMAQPAATNSLAANKALIVDTVTPTVSAITSTTANGSYHTGDAIAITVTFSELVNVTGTPQLTLETGSTDQVVNYSSGSGATTLTWNYTVASGNTSSDLDYKSTSALALNSGTIKDVAGNNAVLTLPTPGEENSLAANKAIVIDQAVPTISSVNLALNNGSIAVTFNEAVFNTADASGALEANDFALSISGGSATLSSATPTSISASGNVYTLGIGLSGTPNGSETLTVVPVDNGIYDAAGNEASTSQSNNSVTLYDQTIPIVSTVTATTANGIYTVNNAIAITITFTEAVTVSGTPQLTLETGSSDAVVNYASGSGGSTITFNYTVASGQNSADLDYVSTAALTLNSGTIKDSENRNAYLTMPTPGTANSLAANKALIIDLSLIHI